MIDGELNVRRYRIKQHFNGTSTLDRTMPDFNHTAVNGRVWHLGWGFFSDFPTSEPLWLNGFIGVSARALAEVVGET